MADGEHTGHCVVCMAGHQRTREEYAQVPMGVEVGGEPLRGDVRVCEQHYNQIRRALICASDEYAYPEDDPSATAREDLADD